MAKRKTELTVLDLIAAVAEPGESMTAWCARVDFPVRTLTRMLSGETEPRLGSVTLLAARLGVDVATLRTALAASRAGQGH